MPPTKRTRRPIKPVRTGAAVLKDIEQGRFASVYVLIGDDTALVDELVGRLRDKLIEPGFEPFDFEHHAADELDLDEVPTRLRQVPSVSTRRLVVITGITRPGSKGPKFCERLQQAGTERLFELVARTPDSTTAVLTGVPHPPLVTILKKVGLVDALVELKPPGPEDLLTLIRRWATERNIAIAADAARLLVEISGLDTGVLRSEVEKLASSVDPGTKVTAGRVRDLAGSSRTWHVKEYVDRLMVRDAAGALTILRRLEEWDENPMVIIAWLTNAFLDLVAARAGVLPSGLLWRVRGALPHWKRVTELNRCLQQLYVIQRAFLSGKPEVWARLEVFTACISCRGDIRECDVFADGEEHELCTIPTQRRLRSSG